MTAANDDRPVAGPTRSDTANDRRSTITVDEAWAIEVDRARADLARIAGHGAVEMTPIAFESGLDLCANDDGDDERGWLVAGLIPAHGFTLQASAPKCGKTWIAESVALALASATPLFGVFATARKPRHVFLLLAEDSRADTKRRLRKLLAGAGLDETVLDRVHVKCRERVDLLNVDHLARVVASVRMLSCKPALVVIDTLRDAHSGSEVEDMDAVSRRLRDLASVLDCALFVTHHVRKLRPRATFTFDDVRGGTELRARMEAGLLARRVDGDGGPIEQKSELRNGAPRTFWLRLDIDDTSARWSYSATRPPKGPATPTVANDNTEAKAKAKARTPDEEREAVYAALDEHVLRSVRDAAKGAQMRPSRAAGYIDELVKANRAKRPAGRGGVLRIPAAIPVAP